MQEYFSLFYCHVQCIMNLEMSVITDQEDADVWLLHNVEVFNVYIVVTQKKLNVSVTECSLCSAVVCS